jgi:putative DNA primase/helicase
MYNQTAYLYVPRIINQTYPVVCLKKNSKEPLHKWSTIHQEGVEERWDRIKHHEGNFAVATGNGLLLIDCDVKQGIDGVTFFEKGVLAALKLDRTHRKYQQTTPSGGKHYFFSYPPGWDEKDVFGNVTGLFGCIDIKSKMGLALIQPSQIDGKSYQIFPPLLPQEIFSPDPLPQEFLAWLIVSMVISKKEKLMPEQHDIITEGTRNNTLYKEALRLFAQGMEPWEVKAHIYRMNGERVRPPLPHREVEALIESASKSRVAQKVHILDKKTGKQNENLEELEQKIKEFNWPPIYEEEDRHQEPYPIEFFPEPMQKGVDAVSKITQAPLSLIANSLLVVESTLNQGLGRIVLGDNRTIPLSLFTLTIAKSGERKTTVDRMLRKPLDDFQARLGKSYQAAFKKYELQKHIWQSKIKKWTSENEGGNISESGFIPEHLLAAEPYEPFRCSLLPGDTTLEALIQSLSKSPIAGIFANEGSTVFNSFNFSAENLGRTLGHYAQLWDGQAISLARVHSGHVHIPWAHVSCSLQVQPALFFDVLKKLGRLGKDSGFLARFLITYPESRIGQRFLDGEVQLSSQLGLECYYDYLGAKIKQFENLYFNSKTNQSLPNPRRLRLSSKAYLAYVELYNRYERECIGRFSSIQEFAAKAAEHALRLAGNFHLALDPQSDEIHYDCIVRASACIDWYTQELLVHGNKFHAEQTPVEILKNALFAYYEKNQINCVPKSWFLQNAPRVLRQKKTLDEALHKLEERGYVKLVVLGNKQWIALNPHWVGDLEEDQPQNSEIEKQNAGTG